MGKSCCSNNPALGLALVRLGTGLLFLLPGVMKFMDGAMFKEMMLQGTLGLSGSMVEVAYWLVVIFEVLGGVAILLGSFIPGAIYKVSVVGLTIVSLVALLAVHIPNGFAGMGLVTVLFQLLATLSLVALYVTKPVCPFGTCKA